VVFLHQQEGITLDLAQVNAGLRCQAMALGHHDVQRFAQELLAGQPWPGNRQGEQRDINSRLLQAL